MRTVLFAVATIVAAFFGQYYVGPALFGSGGATGLLGTFSVGTASALTAATAAGLSPAGAMSLGVLPRRPEGPAHERTT